jgi:hypothetical protein
VRAGDESKAVQRTSGRHSPEGKPFARRQERHQERDEGEVIDGVERLIRRFPVLRLVRSDRTLDRHAHALASVGEGRWGLLPNARFGACDIQNSRETPQYGNDVLGKFIYHLLRFLRRGLWRVNILRQNRRNLEKSKVIEQKKGKRTEVHEFVREQAHSTVCRIAR